MSGIVRTGVCSLLALGSVGVGVASYVNFESSHVHPIALTPSGTRLVAVNTPDARLEVFSIQLDGSLLPERSIPVGLEPVSVVARTDTEAWVVSHLSDSINVVDLDEGVTTRTLRTGDEPTDVAFAAGKAFVSLATSDVVRVWQLANLDAPPVDVAVFGRDLRALAVSGDGTRVYAVPLKSGNQTTIVGVHGTFPGLSLGLDPARLAALGLRDLDCDGPTPSYPPLPPGIVRNPALVDPPDGVPRVGLIVKWNDAAGQWQDDAGQDWNNCLPYRLADDDLFVIDAATLGVTAVKHLGTSLFEVSVHPSGRIYVPNTDARNDVRFEHELGVRGHVVDNRLSVVDPNAGNAVTVVDLNTHIDRASDPSSNLAERTASISQPGMLVWNNDGSAGYLTAIGSRKLFRVDGACLTGACIFGANRAAPDAVEVGEGPTGVARLDKPGPGASRLYVLNRISHSITTVRESDLTVLAERALHDPSPDDTRLGRRFLYDAIDTSGHGDAACSSCHLSGDLDGLAWDLGDPTGDFAPYSTAMDNVRFVVPNGGEPVECPSSVCAAHDGFDPQKGPMTTQTLRGMLEPLHWRGDRATMNDFNMAFVGLMGTADIGPINGKPAGLSAADMERFRQFALDIRFPPNPYRNVDDGMPCGVRSVDPGCEVQVPGSLFPGNPTEGERIFDFDSVDADQPCKACHTHPFGAGGGVLGGVTPAEPTPPTAAALFNGDADGSPHSDLKIPHLRNMYEKHGAVLPPPGSGTPSVTRVGFGHVHDGGIPDMFRFFSAGVFNLSATNQAQDVRDIVSFMFHFPTETRPAVGRQLTVPAGTPPTGTLDDEQLLTALVGLGDASDSARHCELTAATRSGGRLRTYHLSGGAWVTDVAGEPALSVTALREGASAPITFTCATLGSGPRLGGDLDEDSVLDGDDCAPADAESREAPQAITGFTVDGSASTTLTWDDQSPVTGPSIAYDVLGGAIGDLAVSGVAPFECVASALDASSFADTRPDPPPGEGHWYVVRAVNPCGTSPLGAGREVLEQAACP